MKISHSSVIFVCVFLTIFLGGCAPSLTTPTPVPPTFTPSPVPPTSTPKPTATPSITLECSIVKASIQQALPSNVYGITGTYDGPGTLETERLQIDIIGESGTFNIEREVTTEIDAAGHVSVKFDDERAYLNSQNRYKVTGTLVYGIGDLSKLLSYNITVSDIFGTTSQTCTKP